MASQALTAVAGIIIAAIIFLLIDHIRIRQKRQRYAKEHNCQPALHFPHREPFLGLDLFWQLIKSSKEKRRMESTKHLYDHYGLTWQSTSFGREVINTIDPENIQSIRRTYNRSGEHTIDPENIQSVMAQDFESWGLAPLRYPAAGPFMGRGVFTSDGPFWQYARAQVKPVLTRAQFTDYEKLESHLQKFFRVLPKNSEDVDVLPLLERLFTDTMTEFLLGESVDTLMGNSSLDHQAFLDSFTAAAQGVGKRILLGKLKFLFPDKKFKEACHSIFKFIDSRIDQTFDYLKTQELAKKTSSEEKEPLVFIRELAKQTKDRGLIAAQVLNVLNAANDGAAIVISHIIFFLSRYPEVQKKLREEISVIGDKKPDYEQLRNMKYLRYIINETLRLYPLAPTNGRIALKDTFLPRGGGPDGRSPVFVKEGTHYSTNSYILHRREEFWGEDAEEFKPERWETHRQGWEYQAFGGGARTCPGQAFVLSEIGYTVVRILQRYKEIESRDDRVWVENLKLTMSNAHGVVVGLIP